VAMRVIAKRVIFYPLVEKKKDKKKKRVLVGKFEGSESESGNGNGEVVRRNARERKEKV